MQPRGTSQPDKLTHWLAVVLLMLAVAVAAGVRLRLLDFALERDEGEYAYAGQLIWQGIPPYQLAYNMKLPGTYLAYAVLMAVFGQSPAGIHLGLLVVHLATLAALFSLARRWLDVPGACVATATYALMVLSPAYLGLAGHATHFVVLPALLGLNLVLRFAASGRVRDGLAAGGLLGVAFLMKQPGAVFGLFGGLYLLGLYQATQLPWRLAVSRLGWYALGGVLPFLAVCGWLKLAGVFPAFWFWTMVYAREYATIFTLSDGLPWAQAALAKMWSAAPGLWLLAAAGLAALAGWRTAGSGWRFLGGFLVVSALAVCPGFYFRGHYFILLLPAVALLAGRAVSAGQEWLAGRPGCGHWRWLPVALAGLAGAESLYSDRAVFFVLSPEAACRAVYGTSPFPEAAEIARYIAQNTPPDARVAVIGSEPEIYFVAHRHSSTGYIYAYPLMEPQPFADHMQADMIREITANPPAFLVLVGQPTSWEAQPNSSHRLIDWLRGYLGQQMELVGLVQYHCPTPPVTVWGVAAVTNALDSEFYVAVYQRGAAGAVAGADATARNQLLLRKFYQGQNDLMADKFEAIIEHDPENAHARNNLAVILGQEGRTNEAIAEFTAALRYRPDDADAQYNFANLLLKLGRWEESRAHFQAAVQGKSDFAPGHYNLGVAWLKLGHREEALAELQTAVRLQPDYAIAHNSLGMVLGGFGRLEEAIQEFKTALRLKPDYASAQNNLNHALALASQGKEAATPVGKP